MKSNHRYTVNTDEDYEPGSNNEVLKNFLNIKNKNEMDIVEAHKLKCATLEAQSIFSATQKFKIEDICKLHKMWLQDIYPFAGKYRTVNMSKDNFLFAAADLIPKCMEQLEHKYLHKFTPCHFNNTDELAFALGIVHVEIILIHPFREGNGRIARLLADLMSLQSGKPPLNFKNIEQGSDMKGFENYILAIHAGCSENYQPMQHIFMQILENSI